MKWLLRVFFGVTALSLVLAGVGLLLPARVHVERTAFINSPPATVHTLAANLSAFAEWAPWLAEDEELVLSVDGPLAAPGQTLVWSREGARAQGRARVLQTEPYQSVEIEFLFDPGSRATSAFVVAPREGGAEIVWSYDVDFGLNIVSRYAGLGYGDRIGEELERGLEALRALAETLPGADFAAADAELVEVEAVPLVYANGRVRGDSAQQQAAFDAALERVRDFMSGNRVSAGGAAIAYTVEWQPPLWGFRAAVPYDGPARVSGEGPVLYGESYAGRAVTAEHQGDPTGVARLVSSLEAYIAANRLTQAGARWEVLVTEAGEAPAEEQVRRIFIPVE